MPTREDLPADIRDRLPGVASVPGAVPRALPSGRSFIGGKAKEYPGTTPTIEPPPVDPPPPEAKPVLDPCPHCATEVLSTQHFCGQCGYDYKRQTAAQALGVTISKEEIEQYIFTGSLVKVLPLLGDHSATFKSLQNIDIEKSDELVRKHFDKQDPMPIEWQNYRSKVLLAFGWAKIDGDPTGKTFEDRLAWLDQRGAQLIDLASKKFALFNQAITEVLTVDTLKNS